MNERKRQMVTYLDAASDEQIDFLIDLCEQNSGTGNKAGVDRVAAMILESLAGILPVHQIAAQPTYGDHHILRTRRSAAAIYLIGHMDTVFPPDHAFQRCRRDGDRLIGPGTGDMKGGLAVFVYALKALRAAELVERLDLALILNSDEEAGSITSRPLFEEERTKAVACLCGECAGPAGEFVVSRNGKAGARIDSFGTSRHVGRGSPEKASAILELARRILALEALNELFPGVSVNVGRIEGGLGATTIAARASALVDLRWVQEEHRAALLERIDREINRPAADGCYSQLSLLNDRPAWSLTPPGHTLLSRIRPLGAELGQPVLPEHRRGSSDANFFGTVGIPTIDGFGPRCEGDHTDQEWISLWSLRERTVLLALSLAEMGEETEDRIP